MPKVSGKDLISEITEKCGRRLIVISSLTLLVKLYEIPLQDLKILGVDLPIQVFDVVAWSMIIYFSYTLTINWLGDLAAFKLWFTENSIWSQFNTNLKLDGQYLSGGFDLLLRMAELEKSEEPPNSSRSLSVEDKKKYDAFRQNIELYIIRLEAAGNNFRILSWFARFYIFFQSYALPLMLALSSAVVLIRTGSILPAS
jgi:hypothetical protein